MKITQMDIENFATYLEAIKDLMLKDLRRGITTMIESEMFIIDGKEHHLCVSLTNVSKDI